MSSIEWIALVGATAALAACGGPGNASDVASEPVAKRAADPNAQYGSLESGAEYKSWTQMNTEPFFSKGHGRRFVDVYVNDIGLAAFVDDDAEFPLGSIVVKPSWEPADGKPTDVAGPIFVMEKKEKGFDPANEDWWYAIHWEDVPDNWVGRVGGNQIYWRTPSKKVGYCSRCHENFDRAIGGVPVALRTWSAKAEQ